MIEVILEESIEGVFPKISEIHNLGLWLADEVRKSPKGFDIEIRHSLHTIRNSASIISVQPPVKFEFRWNSEYVMDTSIVTIQLERFNDKQTKISVEEIGDFDESRWTKPQEIHIDIWQNALRRLQKLTNS